jgi:hypothetical protein
MTYVTHVYLGLKYHRDEKREFGFQMQRSMYKLNLQWLNGHGNDAWLRGRFTKYLQTLPEHR